MRAHMTYRSPPRASREQVGKPSSPKWVPPFTEQMAVKTLLQRLSALSASSEARM